MEYVLNVFISLSCIVFGIMMLPVLVYELICTIKRISKDAYDLTVYAYWRKDGYYVNMRK